MCKGKNKLKKSKILGKTLYKKDKTKNKDIMVI